jgi:hypothetical protein
MPGIGDKVGDDGVFGEIVVDDERVGATEEEREEAGVERGQESEGESEGER